MFRDEAYGVSYAQAYATSEGNADRAHFILTTGRGVLPTYV
jgi:hypothetical protein